MIKRIQLKNLKIENFKGLQNVDLNFDPETNEILGNNQVGKTSIYDAYMFLLHGTNSMHVAKFNVLPMIEHGKIRESMVEGTFNISTSDKIRITLKRIYRAKKGNIDNAKEASGSTSYFFINGEKTTKTKYNKAVNEILQANMWQILSNPKYFFNNITKQEQRNLILKIVGDISQDEIIASNEKFQRIPEICGNKDTLSQRQILVKNKNKINKDLEINPGKLNELISIIDSYNIENLNEEVIKKELKHISSDISSNYTQINDIDVDRKHNHQILNKNKELTSIKINIEKEKHRLADIQNQQEQEKNAAVHDIEKQIIDLDWQIKNKNKIKVETQTDNIDIKASFEDKIADEARKIRGCKEEFNRFKQSYEQTPSTCFNCNQELPEEMIQKQKSKFESKVEKLKEQAIDAKNKMASLQAILIDNNEKYPKEIEKIEQEIIKIEKEKTNKQHEKAKIIAKFDDKVQQSADLSILQALNNQKSEILVEITQLQQNTPDISKENKLLKERIETLSKKQEQLQGNLNDIKYINNIKKRVENLNKEQQRLSTSYQKILKEIDLIDDFHNTQAEMLEGRINKQLQLGEIKLFEPMVQGGLQATCILTHHGVDYSSLNNATQINLGLSLIEAIAKANSVSVPVWVDGAEGVQRFINIGSQIITLSVITESSRRLSEKLAEYKPSQNHLYHNYKDHGQITWATIQ
jgi:chromosome segregation ATPase